MLKTTLLLLTLAVPATAQTVYDKHGNPVGHFSQEGHRTVLRDNVGDPHGYWQNEGGYRVHRDNDGNLLSRER